MTFLASLIGRPNTLKTQSSLFRRWIEPHLPRSPKSLNDQWMSKMTNLWIEADLSPGTIRSLLALSKKYVLWKTERGLSTSILTRIVSRMEVQEIKKAWTNEQCIQALHFAKRLDSVLYKMMLLTLHTGVRKGEMFGLRWDDVDWLQGKISITRSYDGPTKNGRGRMVPMSDAVENLLIKDYTVGTEDELIFRRCDPNLRLEAICRAANVPRLTWHGLRHTFSTLALEARRSPKLVSAALGHSKLSTTLDMYWQLLNEDLNMDFLPKEEQDG
jgi:integrase